MPDYKVRVSITSVAHNEEMTEARIVQAVGATYEHILKELKIPYEFIEVEIQQVVETPKLEVVRQNGHKKDLTND